MFEQAASDVVLLLDCCAAASSTGEAGGSLTELIAACGFENAAPGVGEHSFTRSLIEELRGWNHHSTMSVAKLHSEVLARIKHWKPRYASNENCERRNTPVYVLIANEGKPRSIELTPLKRYEMSKSDAQLSGPLHTPSDSDEDVEMCEMPDANIMPSSHLSDSLTAVCPEDRYPKVIISVALEEDQVLHTRDWCEWLKSVPAIVKFARVQGIYESDSTLVIMTIPVVIWDLIPADPAIAFLGFVKSENLLSCSELPDSEVTCLQPSHHSVSNQRESNFSVSIRINDRICKASIHPESRSSHISSACVELCGLDRLIDNESSNLSLSQKPAELLPRTSQVVIDVGATTLSHKFLVVDSTDATISLGADFFKAHRAYTDTVRQSLKINGKEVPLLVESEHHDNTEMSLKKCPDKSMLLPKRGIAEKSATSIANSALEGVDVTEIRLGSPKETTKAKRQQRIDGTLATQTIYRPLQTDNMIRLVVLEPASDFDATIHCSLMAVSLDDELLYEAMSYVWGDPSCTCPILLDGNIFQVTLNLERALRHLRYSRREALVLWIDSICIDQRNIEERNSQVMLMGSIYRRARGVLAWLGEGTTNSSVAIGFLKRLNDEFTLLEQGDHLSSLEKVQRWRMICELEPSSSWHSLRELFIRPWWRRLWILQEAALARELTMQCGYLQFDFALVARPAALLSRLLVDCEQQGSIVQYRLSDIIKKSIQIWLGAVRNIIDLKVRLSSSSDVGLMAALKHSFNYESSNSRDKIFALVAVMQIQTTLEPILPNYALSTDLVFFQAARYILEVEQNLEILSWKTYEDPRTKYDLPSWAPDWDRIRAPCLASLRWLCASGSIASLITGSALEVDSHETVSSKRISVKGRLLKDSHEAVPSKRISVQGRVLKVRGIQADTLKEIGERYISPAMTFAQLSKLSQEAQSMLYRAQPTMQETVWWEEFLDHSCEQPLNLIRRLDGTSSITFPRRPKIALESQDTCTHPDFNRLNNISITSRGYVCFIPPGSQAGDVVCVLVSAKTPFILRMTDDGTHFRLIGEWLVLSMESSDSH